PYLDPKDGVVRVPKQRWQQAQRYERETWMVANTAASDDRNSAHYGGFRGYEALRGRTFLRAIELGCGPFTNLRLIGRTCTIAQCSLLDPLIKDYLNHPHCTYNRQMLRTSETPLGETLGRTLPGRALRRALRVIAPGTIVRSI